MLLSLDFFTFVVRPARFERATYGFEVCLILKSLNKIK
jgi:hypothetical protein